MTDTAPEFRLLITGASGLLGSNLVRLAAGRRIDSCRCQVTAVLHAKRAAAPAQGSHSDLPSFESINADLCQPGAVERIFDQARPDAVIHCAAMTDVDRCESHPSEAGRINADLPGHLARVAVKNRVQFLHISTDSVFDGLAGGYCEDDAPRPVNVYSRTKLDGETKVLSAYPDALIARVNFYGWSWQGSRSLAEWFYLNLAAGKAIQGFSDVVFCPLLANDLVEILLRMLELRFTGLYHVVSSESQSKFDFGRMLARAFGLDESRISPASHRSAGLQAARSPVLTLSCAKLEQALGEKMPGQAEAMGRFVDLRRQGYPQALQRMFSGYHSSAETLRTAFNG